MSRCKSAPNFTPWSAEKRSPFVFLCPHNNYDIALVRGVYMAARLFLGNCPVAHSPSVDKFFVNKQIIIMQCKHIHTTPSDIWIIGDTVSEMFSQMPGELLSTARLLDSYFPAPIVYTYMSTYVTVAR